MRRVQFPLQVVDPNSDRRVVYPDDIGLFGNVDISGDTVYADYYGDDENIADGPARMVQAQFSPREFLKLFTAEEKIAILTAKSTDVIIERFLYEMSQSQIISLEDDDCVAGIAYMRYLGLLTQDRYDRIMLGMEPEV